jgi:hypothetical protein
VDYRFTIAARTRADLAKDTGILILASMDYVGRGKGHFSVRARDRGNRSEEECRGDGPESHVISLLVACLGQGDDTSVANSC